MQKFKVIRNEEGDYFMSNGEKRYAIEYASLDEYGNVIDYGEDWQFFDTEKEANKFIKQYNKQLN